VRRKLFALQLHPRIVATTLSATYSKQGLGLHTPPEAAQHLLTVIEQLAPTDNAGFFNWRGMQVH